MNPQFPIYIPSKGRAESRITVRHLDAMKVPYYVIVEEQEFCEYAASIDRSKLLILDRSYQDRYETFDDLADSKSKGPGPARNFAWDHAIAMGAAWHWVIDDNIKGFFRLNHNLKVPVADGTIFRCMEDFILRYKNVAMAGPNYFKFASRKSRMPPFVLNTRIYSCNLIRNDTPFQWRCRYNEDTDLSLRMLKAGWCTIQFNAFLQDKANTQTIKGGNTDDFYIPEGTLPKSQMLVRAHPDVAELVYKFSRWHHRIDYRPFKKNKLLRRDDLELSDNIDNYGMHLVPRRHLPIIRQRVEAV
jgi:TET-associated glycosyltransferase-like protein